MGEKYINNYYAYTGGNPVARSDLSGLAWIYQQSTGNLYQTGNNPSAFTYVGTGYSGSPTFYNNGMFENLDGQGPIPVGDYSIGPIGTNKIGAGHILPDSMRLTADPGQWLWSRSGFLIHGSKDYANHTGSEGCAIFRPDIRKRIGNSGDYVFEVVP